MSVYLLAAVVFALAIAGMAIGVVISGRSLRGSCGGMAGMKDSRGNPICEACTNPAEECEDFRKKLEEEEVACEK